jgi:hypothetical protein
VKVTAFVRGSVFSDGELLLPQREVERRVNVSTTLERLFIVVRHLECVSIDEF